MSQAVIGERTHFTVLGTALMRAHIVHMPGPEEYLPARRTDIYPGHVPALRILGGGRGRKLINRAFPFVFWPGFHPFITFSPLIVKSVERCDSLFVSLLFRRVDIALIEICPLALEDTAPASFQNWFYLSSALIKKAMR
ncbi:hypothetical protein CEXT_211411 [Caerostris extrusa]|uniref:Uncharacterized protein n=1 Tax=Caerostris extrusa TaxID=172846 RepID=A0AAV4Q8B8_CAEEX|nr:hypothetical protein CEXT_211411 [Caerostris extrusa]